jgi:hypothetical protein
MEGMFLKSLFNGDISEWNVSNVKYIDSMFKDSNFKQNISNWKINPKCNANWVFYNCDISSKHKPKALQ